MKKGLFAGCIVLVCAVGAASAQTYPAGQYVNTSDGSSIEFRGDNEVVLSELGIGSYARCISGGGNWCVSGSGYDCSFKLRWFYHYTSFTLAFKAGHPSAECGAIGGTFTRQDP